MSTIESIFREGYVRSRETEARSSGLRIPAILYFGDPQSEALGVVQMGREAPPDRGVLEFISHYVTAVSGEVNPGRSEHELLISRVFFTDVPSAGDPQSEVNAIQLSRGFSSILRKRSLTRHFGGVPQELLRSPIPRLPRRQDLGALRTHRIVRQQPSPTSRRTEPARSISNVIGRLGSDLHSVTSEQGTASEARSETADTSPPSAQQVVQALQTVGDHGQMRAWIIEAEACAFDERQLPIVRPILRNFIIRYRESQDRIDQVAVASAIRKYVASMRVEEFSDAGFLLEVGGRSSLPIGIELEVTKMVVRKLTARPEFASRAGSDLAERLAEIARTYLSDRLLARDKHGATALNAVMGLALLDSGLFDDCLPILGGLRSQWFLNHLANRSSILARDLASRFQADAIGSRHEKLSHLAAMRDVRA